MKGIAAIALFLPACGGGGSPSVATNQTAPAPAARLPDNSVDCQVRGSDRFEPSCSLSIAGSPRGRLLTIRKPDGELRELLVTRDRRGFVDAEGSARVLVERLSGRRLEVAIDGDRFRLGDWVLTW